METYWRRAKDCYIDNRAISAFEWRRRNDDDKARERKRDRYDVVLLMNKMPSFCDFRPFRRLWGFPIFPEHIFERKKRSEEEEVEEKRGRRRDGLRSEIESVFVLRRRRNGVVSGPLSPLQGLQSYSRIRQSRGSFLTISWFECCF